MKIDAMVGSDFLAADDIEQLGESIDDAIRCGFHIIRTNGQQADERGRFVYLYRELLTVLRYL